MLRKPAVAGQFYPSDPQELKKLIASFIVEKVAVREKAIACILPHAGYIYSGKVAAQVISKIEIEDTCIILGPNHNGYGSPYSIMKSGDWATPLGSIKIDTDLATKLINNSLYLTEDDTAHFLEHSIEVELPLLQVLSKENFSFVPMVFSSTGELICKDIANSIAGSIRSHKKPVTIIASSDMTHYEPQKNANKKDEEAIKSILKLDEQELLDKVEKMGISMCGYAPVAVTILAAKILGAKKAKLIAYQTSGDVTGDNSSVVGYAGIVIQ